MKKKLDYYFYYTDSLGIKRKIEYQLNEYLHLMLLIFDRGYEDWGDCKGRAWCGTCHIRVDELLETRIELDEQHTLSRLPNQTEGSRLACQIQLDEHLHQKHFCFLGDFDT